MRPMSKLAQSEADNKSGDDAPFGSAQKVFDAVEELACMAGIQADLIRLYATAEDMTGIEYSTRRLWAYMRALGGIIKDFKDHGQTLGPRGES